MKWLVAALVLLTTGCSSTMACTLVGCASEARVRLVDLSPGLQYPLTARACFDQRCADMTIGKDPPAADQPAVLSCPGEGRHACVDLRGRQGSAGGYAGVVFQDPPAGDGVHTASVLVRNASGAVVMRSSRQIRLEKLAPNGERCGPICWSATADFR